MVMVMMMVTADLGAVAARTRHRIVSYRIGREETLVYEFGHASHLFFVPAAVFGRQRSQIKQKVNR